MVGIGVNHLGLITAQTIYSPSPATAEASSRTIRRTEERNHKGKAQLPAVDNGGPSSMYDNQPVIWDFSKGQTFGQTSQQNGQLNNHSTQPTTVWLLPQYQMAQQKIPRSNHHNEG